MKCPHCDYSYNEFDYGDGGMVNISTGTDPFYYHPVHMIQIRDYENNEMLLVGCPDCRKTFISSLYSF